jgi:hypothetical protein
MAYLLARENPAQSETLCTWRRFFAQDLGDPIGDRQGFA